MKKTKLSLGLISCLLSVGTLAGCDTLKSSSDGVLLSYTVDGIEGVQTITADQILGDYYNDSTKYQAIYDTIYSVIARNYFSAERKAPTDSKYSDVKLGKPQMQKIERDAREKVSDDKDTAQTNADTNNTKYKKEFEAILESKGVDSEEELYNKYVEELQKETFENNFYTYFVEDIKNGDANTKLEGEENPFWTGYFEDQVPYHVSHILVKLADTSDTNYHNGTISQANAERLYNIVTNLNNHKKSFAKVAENSEDPGSKDKEGDLGIMDLDTSFINEFKLGIYAYEQFYNKKATAEEDAKVTNSNIGVTETIANNYNKEAKELFGIGDGEIPTVDVSVFDVLNTVAKDETDEKGKPVIENASLVFPRNIIYNKYLNKHAVFFIEDSSAVIDDDYKKVHNFREWQGKKILCADGDPTKPIIAVRASSGGEQEIHFMVVNRSPFDTKDKDGVDLIPLTDYYTTFYPAQDFYPKYKDDYAVEAKRGQKMETYVNFLTNEASDTKSRAEEFASKLKSYNSDKLGKYIFLKYMQEEQIKFEDATLQAALMKWIKTSINKASEEKKESWTKTWNEYIDKLVRQNSERKKLVPQACRLMYLKANSESLATSIIPIDENDVNYKELIADLVASGRFDYDDNGVKRAEADIKTAAKTYANAELAKEINKLFKTEGGLCNDGKAHL